jgi:hypothetical protein
MISNSSPSHATNRPPVRKLRAYAFDPSLSLKIDTVEINQLTYKLPWEDLEVFDYQKHETDPPLDTLSAQGIGPVGEYVELIDFDPTVNKFYSPVDLNDPYILAQEGLEPNEGNPQFHQQMVYTVAMTTITNFERALGRKIMWSPRRLADSKAYEEYVQHLRIYPHALRESNAYYSPQKKAILFGYFASTPADETLHMPASLVFTCLSHDIIAHEVTHAILDGMYRHYNEPTNPDVLAFHEAFADIVALFQHFTFPEVLKHQIAKTRGDLASQNLLGELAQEFGSAIGKYGSLRNALGETDPKTKEWKPKDPKPAEYRVVLEPHARGSILVAAVFEAFLIIYKSRVADLLRIASNGTGILPQGALHPDLVTRLANEAAKSAGHVLSMCIRALDYCPPVDITFGDYLRGIITADSDLVPDDTRDYRLAFIDAFRRRGIYPQRIKSLSVGSLRHRVEPFVSSETKQLLGIISEFLRDYRNEVIYETDRRKIFNISRKYIAGTSEGEKILGLHNRIFFKFEDLAEYETLTGLVFSDWKRLGVRTSRAYGNQTEGPSFQVQSLRLVSRSGPGGKHLNHIAFSLIQRAGVIVKAGAFAGHYVPGDQDTPPGGFELRGGCTMIFDLDTLQLKYAITRTLLDQDQLDIGKRQIDCRRAEKQCAYQYDEGENAMSEYARYFGMGLSNLMNEPFALLHQQ